MRLVIPRRTLAALIIAAATSLNAPFGAAAETIHFGGNAHGLTGQAAAQFTSGGFQMSLVAGPSGAVLNENHGAALGIDSRAVPGAVDTGAAQGLDKINLLGGAPSGAGVPEMVAFSFNSSGVLRHLLFDGVKDETLEYFALSLPDGSVRSIFDFEAELRLTQQGFSLATLAVPGVTLLDGPDDDALELNIPFRAGDEFVLSYGEFPYPPGYVPLTPNQPPNGARWEGLVIVPEPAALPLAVLGSVALVRRRKRG